MSLAENLRQLGLGRDASEGEVKRAFRALALKWHPDRNPSNVAECTEKFKRINEAYTAITSSAVFPVRPDSLVVVGERTVFSRRSF